MPSNARIKLHALLQAAYVHNDLRQPLNMVKADGELLKIAVVSGNREGGYCDVAVKGGTVRCYTPNRGFVAFGYKPSCGKVLQLIDYTVALEKVLLGFDSK